MQYLIYLCLRFTSFTLILVSKCNSESEDSDISSIAEMKDSDYSTKFPPKRLKINEVTIKDVIHRCLHLLPNPLSYHRDYMFEWTKNALKLFVSKKTVLNSKLLKKLVTLIYQNFEVEALFFTLLNSCHSKEMFLSTIKKIDEKQSELTILHSEFTKILFKTNKNDKLSSEKLLKLDFAKEKVDKFILKNILWEYEEDLFCSYRTKKIMNKLKESMEISELRKQLYDRNNLEQFYKTIFLHYEPILGNYLKQIFEAEKLHCQADGSYTVLFYSQKDSFKIEREIDFLKFRTETKEDDKGYLFNAIAGLDVSVKKFHSQLDSEKISTENKTDFGLLFELIKCNDGIWCKGEDIFK